MSTTRYVLVAAAGAVASGALPPFGGWFLLLALAPFLVLVADSERSRDAFWLGFWFAIPFFVLHIWWLPASFAVPFGPFFWLVFPLLLLALAVIWGGTSWLVRLVGGRGRATLALLPAVWVMVEWARSQGYLGFPWGVFGYAWLETPIAQIADTVGVYGLSLLGLTAAALVATPFVHGDPGKRKPAYLGGRPRSRVAWLAPVAALFLVGGAWAVGSAKLGQPLPDAPYRALLVQPNADPFARITAVQAEQELNTLLTLTEQGVRALPEPPDLVVWPEGAVLGLPVVGTAGEPTRRRIAASAPDSTIIFGTRVRERADSFNAVLALTDGQVVDRYDKRVLVPFGERWPFIEIATPLYRAVFGLFGLPLLADTTPGDTFEPLDTPAGVVGAYVCYESVFPQVTAAMVGNGGAELLVNITNDAWFARGAGAQQHFDMGKMRAIETGRYMLRSGNDGITAAVDPRGQTISTLARATAGTLSVPYDLRSQRTPYIRWGSLLLPLIATYAALVALVAAARR